MNVYAIVANHNLDRPSVLRRFFRQRVDFASNSASRSRSGRSLRPTAPLHAASSASCKASKNAVHQCQPPAQVLERSPPEPKASSVRRVPGFSKNNSCTASAGSNSLKSELSLGNADYYCRIWTPVGQQIPISVCLKSLPTNSSGSFSILANA